MKRGILIILEFILLIILFINFAYADFELGEEPDNYEITTAYAPSETLRGWMNISFNNEPANSTLSAFDQNITLKEFLDNNDADYSCSPKDCNSAYSSVGSGNNSKQFSLQYWESKLVGVKLTGQITGIDSLSFYVSTNAGKSCLNPVKIDVRDDGNFEWKSEEISNDECYMETPYGCWDEADYLLDQEFEISEDPYCEKINISFGKGFKIGADIIGSGNANFKMQVTAESESAECDISVTAGGKINCSVEFDNAIEEQVSAEVCINREDSGANVYKIKYEDVSPCGSAGGEDYDFPIFLYPKKFSSVGDINFNQDLIDEGNTGIDLASEIWDYIDDKYGGNCNPQCIIPIRFYAGIDQTTTIYNLNLVYKKGGTKSETKIYNIKDSVALINSNFSKLDLEKTGFKVPKNRGDYTLELNLNSETLIDEEIEVKNVPIINYIYPTSVPAIISNRFITVLDANSSNLTYTWNFGDNSTKQSTSNNAIEHAYQKLGTYSLTVTVSNRFGNSSKTIQVVVGSPKDYVNVTINDYNKKLDSIKAEINKLPVWVQNEIKKQFDVDSLKNSVKNQKTRYDSAFEPEDYTEIMEALTALNIPNSFNLSQKINSSEIVPNPEQLNLDALDSFGAGNIDGTEEDYKKAVTYWFMNTLQMTMELNTYSLYYDNETKDLLSYVKIKLTPRPDQKLGEVYFLVNGDPSKIKFNTNRNSKEYTDAAGVIIPELESQEIIEFLYPGKINIGSFPVYISPEFRNLDVGIEPGICNFNKKCDKDLGENSKNCPVDCGRISTVWTLIWIIIVLFIGLIIYIILQEWYKRHYERHLFPNRNQLFNLINFMSISSNQGMRKSEIFNKLKDLKWTGEQLRYAWNKFQGKRTGMWEIPIFKWVENKEVRRELEKRQNIMIR